MAAVLQHQIVGKVNDLNTKLSAHARIIFQLSVEVDNLKSENEELKKILRGHKMAIKQLRDQPNDTKICSEINSNIEEKLNERNEIDSNYIQDEIDLDISLTHTQE